MLTVDRLKRVSSRLPHLFKREAAYWKLRKTLNVRGLSAIVSDHLKSGGQNKFVVKCNYYLRANVLRALMLGLDHVPKQRILDLGCGAGYFLLASRFFGHTVTGLDRHKSTPVFADLINLFDLTCVRHDIFAFSQLPETYEKYDLITAFAVCFDRDRQEKPFLRWTRPEWAYFLENVKTLLSINGKFFMHTTLFISHEPDLLNLFENIDGFQFRIINEHDFSFVNLS